MSAPLICRKLEIKPSLIHGLGVFAAEDIAAGDIITECYTVFYTEDIPELSTYYFHVPNDYALVLGYGSMLNHSFEANTKYQVNRDTAITTFNATQFIKAGEEILMNYTEVWFSSRDCRPIQESLCYKIKTWFHNLLKQKA